MNVPTLLLEFLLSWTVYNSRFCSPTQKQNEKMDNLFVSFTGRWYDRTSPSTHNDKLKTYACWPNAPDMLRSCSTTFVRKPWRSSWILFFSILSIISVRTLPTANMMLSCTFHLSETQVTKLQGIFLNSSNYFPFGNLSKNFPANFFLQSSRPLWDLSEFRTFWRKGRWAQVLLLALLFFMLALQNYMLGAAKHIVCVQQFSFWAARRQTQPSRSHELTHVMNLTMWIYIPLFDSLRFGRLRFL